jgi:hypothetical protein
MHVRNRFLARACAAAAAGVALSTVAVTAASASGGGGVPARPSALVPAGLVAGPGGPASPRAGAASVTSSSNFAGYLTPVTAGSATTVTATFTVPALSCAPPDLGNFPVVGMGTTSTASNAGVAVKCESDKPVYFPALAINGVGHSFRTSPIAAGDSINLFASVTTTATTVTVTDVTQNVTTTLTGAGASPSRAWIGDLGVYSNKGVLLGVPDFGKLKFFHCQIDGATLQSWNPQQWQRVNAKGIVQITTGPFSPPGGLAFATYYKHQ